MYDLVLKNANVITMDNKSNIEEWVAVSNGRIAALGNGESPEGKSVIDLEGKTVLPGLFDSHCHVMSTGQYLSGVDLIKATSIEEVLSMMEKACKETKEGEWVFGGGYASHLIKENRFPTCAELDEISHGCPILITTQTLHGCVLNTLGLEKAGVPQEGLGIELDKNGKRTGTLTEDDIVFSAQNKIIGSLSDETLWKYISKCAEYASTKGVTSMSGLVGQFVEGDRDVDLIMKKGDKLPINIQIFYQTWDIEKVLDLGLPRIGGCLTLDGAGFEYTMALQEPYPGRPERRGFLIHTDEEIYNLISKAHKNDIQCAFHALGDRAIDQLVYIYQQVIMEQGAKDLRHRIEHFSLPSPKHIDLLVQHRLIASMQPAFPGLWGAPGDVYVPMLGRERADQMEIFPDIYNKGGIICGGSDSPVTMVDPLFGIACCIDNPDPRRNLPITEAIALFTRNAAYAVNLEKSKGTIEIGKDADFTVIDKDPYVIGRTKEIYNMNVMFTIKKGEIMYAAE